jgi:PDZ domain-containing protein
MAHRTLMVSVLLLSTLCFIVPHAGAQYVGQLTVVAASSTNQAGDYEYIQIFWDQKPEPEQLHVLWSAPGIKYGTRPGVYGGVKLGQDALGSLAHALEYAVERTPSIRHSGTVTMQAVTNWPSHNDGPSAGAALTVAFLAMFNNTPIRSQVCLTGTLESGGRIGKVGAIPDKMRAARRSSCSTMLVPRFQTIDQNWNLDQLGLALKLQVKEVETVEEAYEIMTARRL